MRLAAARKNELEVAVGDAARARGCADVSAVLREDGLDVTALELPDDAIACGREGQAFLEDRRHAIEARIARAMGDLEDVPLSELGAPPRSQAEHALSERRDEVRLTPRLPRSPS